MSELLIPKVEKDDIYVPEIAPEGSVIVFQRHERYQRTRDAEDAGSIFPEAAEDTYGRDLEFFNELVEDSGEDVMVLFVSSDTQYAGKGRRSLETGQLAQDAAVEAMTAAGLDPNEHIINFNPNFNPGEHEETDQHITPMRHVREPQMFDQTPEFVDKLRDMFGAAEEVSVTENGDTQMRRIGLSQDAWSAYESDTPEVQQARAETGAEGVYDILDRTKKGLRVLERYSDVFHAKNPGKKLVIWMASHYDTISPLVKDATDTSFDEYVPVDYGGGVLIELPPKEDGERVVTLSTRSAHVALNLGRVSREASHV